MDGKHRHKVDQKLKPLKRKWKKSNLLWCYIFGSGTLVALDFLFLTLKRLLLPCAWNFSLVSKISLCSNGNISIAHHYFWFRLSSCPPTHSKNGLNSLFSGLLHSASPTHTFTTEDGGRGGGGGHHRLQQHQSKTTTTAMHCFKIYFRKVFWMQLLKLL